MGADESGGRPGGADEAPGDTHPAGDDPLLPLLEKLARAPAVRTLKPGDAVGRFELIRELGRGGFGVVYEARDRELGRKVALKMMSGSSGSEVEQALGPLLRREAATAARLNHSNIVTLYDLGVFEGAPYLVLELLEGETLAQRLARGPLPPRAAAEIALEVARALVHAHRVGVIHRDLKPSNVFLVRSGGVKVLDLGLARLVAAVENIRSAVVPDAALQGAGTPAYMAPEQWRGEPGDERTDVFSLGVTMYEMVAGRLPFDIAGRGKAALLDTQEAARLDGPLAEVVATALAKDPARRYQTAQQLLDALARANGSRPDRRRWPLVAAVVVALGGAAVLLGRSHPPAASAAIGSRKSVAVLGFKNLSGRADAGWISTALGETLTTELSLGDRLRTVPGEKVARVKNDLSLGDADGFEVDTLARLRRNLATDYVVLGSYLATGGGPVRVDVRLQDTQTGETVAAIAESGTESDLIGLVGRVGGRLRERLGAGGLSVTDTAAARRAMPQNPEAARLYSEGLARHRQFDAVGARALLERAVAAEPDSPLPHAALADAYADLGLDVQARAESKKAFELSSGLSREERLSIEARYRRANAELDKAIEIDKTLVDFYPDNVEYGLDLAAAYIETGRNTDALAAVARLRRLPAPASDDPRIDLMESDASTDMKRGMALAQEAARKGEALGARLLVAQARQNEASSRMWSGDWDGAIRLAEAARPLFEAAGNQYGVAQSLFPIACAVLERDDDMPRAVAIFREQLAIFRKSGMRAWQAKKLGDLAFGYLNMGDTAAAREVIDEAGAIARELHDESLERRARTIWGWMLWEEGDVPAARERLESWLATLKDRSASEPAFATMLARVWVAQGEIERARKLIDDEELFLDKQAQSWDLGSVRAQLALVLLEDGRLAEAETVARKGIAGFRELKILGGLDDPLNALARVLVAEGKLDEAAGVLDELARMKAHEWNRHDQLDVAILGARLRVLRDGSAAVPEALRALDGARRDAARWHLGEPEWEARLYHGELEVRAGRPGAREHLLALARDARARGFILIARKAAAAAR